MAFLPRKQDRITEHDGAAKALVKLGRVPVTAAQSQAYFDVLMRATKRALEAGVISALPIHTVIIYSRCLHAFLGELPQVEGMKALLPMPTWRWSRALSSSAP